MSYQIEKSMVCQVSRSVAISFLKPIFQLQILSPLKIEILPYPTELLERLSGKIQGAIRLIMYC